MASMVYIFYFAYLIIGTATLPKTLYKGFLKSIMLFLLLIIGLRSSAVGSDTSSYMEEFLYMSNMDLSAVLDTPKNAGEPLFFFITWLLGQIFPDTTFYLMVWALLSCGVLYQVMKEELDSPRDYLVAILCFFVLGFFSFFVAGLRQTAAISIVFYSYKYLKNIDFSFSISSFNKPVILKFLICILLAYNLHNSSAIFLIALPFLKFKVQWWYLPGIVGLFFISSFLSTGLLVEVTAFLFKNRYEAYGTSYESSQTISAFIMQFILFLICYFQRDNLIVKDKSNIYLFNLVVVGMAFQSLSGMLYEMARVAYYFSIFYLILVPRAFKEYPVQFQPILYMAFCFLVIIYLFFLSSANLPLYSSVLF